MMANTRAKKEGMQASPKANPSNVKSSDEVPESTESQDRIDLRESDEKPICGIVMPISEIDGCTTEHWRDVNEILVDALVYVGFKARLVSNADEVGVIHRRIVQNLYEDPIVVCDVSGKNPNVMFELGMRLAFDKPTIIVKDDRTSYSFDTSPVEHLEYPRDLRFSNIVDFKLQLGEKVRSTLRAYEEQNGYTTFLQHFGSFKVAKIDVEDVGARASFLKEIESLRDELLTNQSMLHSLTSSRRDLGTTKRYRDLSDSARIRTFRDGRAPTSRSKAKLWSVSLESRESEVVKMVEKLLAEGDILDMTPAVKAPDGWYSTDISLIAELTSRDQVIDHVQGLFPLGSGTKVTAARTEDLSLD